MSVASTASSLLPEPVRTFRECDEILTAKGQMHELDEAVIDGRKMRVFKNAPPSMRLFWLGVSSAFAKREYLVLGNERLTYAETHKRVVALAALLSREYRCQKGEKVAILMRNRPDWVISFWACHLLGCVPALVNAWVAPDGIVHCLKIANCVLAIVDEERAAVLDGQKELLKPLRLRAILVSGTNTSVPKHMIALQGKLTSGKWDQADVKSLPDVRVQPDDDGFIFFTSGTTSFPKAVLTTQRAFITNLFNTVYGGRRATVRKGEEVVIQQPEDPQKVILMAIPFFHVTGCASFLQLFTAIGGRVVMMHKWTTKEALRLCKSEGVTYTGGVPFIAQELLESAKNDELASVEAIAFGGAPCGDNVPALAARIPTLVIGQAYGLTETSAVVAGHAGEDYLKRPLSCGLPSLVNDIKILNENEKELPTGQIGEICIRGPNVMKCYYNDEKATKAAFTSDGFFKSGDLGSFDTEGFLYIQDRAKDIIIRGGENIAATTVENALFRDPCVQDCAVVAVKDPKLGELPAAVVVLRPGSKVTEADIIDASRKHLPRHAVPVMVMLRLPTDDDASTRIERNPNGKIVKAQLKKVVDQEWQRRNRAKL